MKKAMPHNTYSKGTPLTFSKLMVPVDFSSISENVLWQAAALAQRNTGSLVLFHAVEPVIHPIEFAIVPPEMDEINLRAVEAAERRLKPICEEIRGSLGIRCRAMVQLGRAWKKIVDAAEENKVDLIVMPTHGRTGLNHALLGSTAERVIQHAPCSVLVLRAGDQAKKARAAKG